MKLKKIYILGTVGSGKTFLGNKLAKKLKIKHYDLDDVYWEKRYTKRRNKKDRIKMLGRICEKGEWVIEGVYGDYIENTLKRADKVILLDFPLRILLWRITLRAFTKKDRTSKDLFKLYKYALDYKKSKKSKYGFEWHEHLIRKNHKDCIVVKNENQLREILKKI